MAASAVASRAGKTVAQIELETRQRETKAVGLRAENLSYEAIAAEVGWTDASAARKAIQRVLDRHEESNVDELRRVENAKIDMLEAELRRILSIFHPKIDHGKIMKDRVMVPAIDKKTGEPILANGNPTFTFEDQSIEDVAPRIQAVREFRQLLARRAALRGLDAPLRKIVEVITDDAVQAEIRRLTAMMDELDLLDEPESAGADKPGL